MAASATFALKAGVWFRRGRLFIASPDSLGTASAVSRNSTYRPVQILKAGSDPVPEIDDATLARHAASFCRDGIDRQRTLELLDAEIKAFNDLIAAQCSG